jgi:uncharacterized membrane protein YfcA
MAAVAFGALVQGILGFGCSLVWMSIFPLFTTVPDAVGVLQPLAICLNALLLSRIYRHATPRELRPLAITAPLGIGFGLWVVIQWPERAVNGLLGSFLVLYMMCRSRTGPPSEIEDAITVEMSSLTKQEEETNEARSVIEPMMLVLEMEPEIPIDEDVDHEQQQQQQNQHQPEQLYRNPKTLVAGFVGGCLTSAFGTGGPAILVYASEAQWEHQPDMFRANLQVIFFSMNVLAISSQVVGGIITADTMHSSVWLFPALVGGGMAGAKLATWVPKGTFQALVLFGLGAMGILFLFKAVFDT